MTAPPGNIADRPAAAADLIGSPEKFADPPAREDAALGLGADGQSHDLLSELLRSVRLTGERIVAYAPSPAFSVGFAGTGSLHIVEEGGKAAVRMLLPVALLILPALFVVVLVPAAAELTRLGGG